MNLDSIARPAVSARALVFGAVAGMSASCGFLVVGTIAAPVFLLVALMLVMGAPRRDRKFALMIAVTTSGSVRAIGLVVDPTDPASAWLTLLAIESAIAAVIGLRWPLWGAAGLFVSTALHRARVVDMSWRPEELPLAIFYGVLAGIALFAAVRVSRRERSGPAFPDADLP